MRLGLRVAAVAMAFAVAIAVGVAPGATAATAAPRRVVTERFSTGGTATAIHYWGESVPVPIPSHNNPDICWQCGESTPRVRRFRVGVRISNISDRHLWLGLALDGYDDSFSLLGGWPMADGELGTGDGCSGELAWFDDSRAYSRIEQAQPPLAGVFNTIHFNAVDRDGDRVYGLDGLIDTPDEPTNAHLDVFGYDDVVVQCLALEITYRPTPHRAQGENPFERSVDCGAMLSAWQLTCAEARRLRRMRGDTLQQRGYACDSWRTTRPRARWTTCHDAADVWRWARWRVR